MKFIDVEANSMHWTVIPAELMVDELDSCSAALSSVAQRAYPFGVF